LGILIHACCAPCLTYTYEYFKENFSEDPSVLWFNPNIHPFKEYEKRLGSLKKYQGEMDIEIIYKDNYDLENFLEGALGKNPRCQFCYRLRLSKAAEVAKENGFNAYTTTLTISPYQDHDLIKKIGREEGEKIGIEFIYVDLTDGFYKSHDIADEMDLYKQGYCGCIFSEMDRYKKE